MIGVGGRGGGGSGGRADVDNAGAEFDADGHVVLGDEAPFAEADCELGGEVISNGVGDAGEWGNLGVRWISRCRCRRCRRVWRCNPMVGPWFEGWGGESRGGKSILIARGVNSKKGGLKKREWVSDNLAF